FAGVVAAATDRSWRRKIEDPGNTPSGCSSAWLERSPRRQVAAVESKIVGDTPSGCSSAWLERSPRRQVAAVESTIVGDTPWGCSSDWLERWVPHQEVAGSTPVTT